MNRYQVEVKQELTRTYWVYVEANTEDEAADLAENEVGRDLHQEYEEEIWETTAEDVMLMTNDAGVEGSSLPGGVSAEEGEE